MALDAPDLLTRHDPRGFWQLLRRLPEQLIEAWGLAEAAPLPPGPIRQVAVLGMGGSAIGGDLLRALARDRLPVPVEVVRGYALPAWIGPEALVVAVSYSGDTEETLSAFEAALARGAAPLVLTGGGELGRRARGRGLPLIELPAGFPPRAALAYLFLPLLRVLERVGLALLEPGELAEAAELLGALGDELGPGRPEAENPAKALARWLHDRLPVVYGTDGLSGPCAYRWKTQLEENAKVLAVAGVLPELGHNELTGWAGDPLAGRCAALFLRDAGDHPRVARRIALTRAIVDRAAESREVWSRGRGRLARLLSLVATGDWVSLYLAALRGVDPWPVETIEALKRQLEERV